MPSPVCACGHGRALHHVRGARVCRVLDCACEDFRPKATATCQWCGRRAAFLVRWVAADGGVVRRWVCELHWSELEHQAAEVTRL